MEGIRRSLTFANLLLLLTSINVNATPAAQASDDDLDGMLARVDGVEFGGLMITAMRGSQVDLVGAAAWTVMTDCNEQFAKLVLTDRAKFNMVYESNFEDHCFEILPVYYRHQQQIDLLAEEPGRRRERTLQKLALACRELIKAEVKDEAYNRLVRSERGKKDPDNHRSEFSQLRFIRQKQHESIGHSLGNDQRCLSLANKIELLMALDSDSDGESRYDEDDGRYYQADYDHDSEDDEYDMIELELSRAHPYERWVGTDRHTKEKQE